MNALTVQNLTYAYDSNAGHAPVLKEFSLTLASRAFEALMGPSGSGKSTFLHLVAGLLPSPRGTIQVGTQDVSALGEDAAARFRRRHVGLVFQSGHLLNALTVEENITLPVRLDHQRVDRVRVHELTEKLGIAPLLTKRAQALSGGERQRVALARALLARPEIVLADEPTGNLDRTAAREVCDLLKDLNQTEESAILLVTHDPLVAACAQRVHFLKDGICTCTRETNHDPEAISRTYLETYP